MQRAIEARALQQEGQSHHWARRSLAPNATQKVTLGVGSEAESNHSFKLTLPRLQVIGAYVGLIAILWNLPYVKYVLWPWKMLTIA